LVSETAESIPGTTGKSTDRPTGEFISELEEASTHKSAKIYTRTVYCDMTFDFLASK